jgi:hypothetical protein
MFEFEKVLEVEEFSLERLNKGGVPVNDVRGRRGTVPSHGSLPI